MTTKEFILKGSLHLKEIKRAELLKSDEYSKSQIDKALKALVKDGLLVREKPGVYGYTKELEVAQTFTKEEIERQAKARDEMEAIVKKKLKKIFRKHKMYVRGRNGMLRRLDRLSPNIYETVLVAFMHGGASKRYEVVNKNVKHWKDWQPISLELEVKFKDEFNNILKKVLGFEKVKNFTVYYNGSWKPLVQLTIKKNLNSIDKET